MAAGSSVSKGAVNSAASALTVEDLIPDRALKGREEDAFGHREIAERVAELVVLAETPVNIALFGPWGSGKSSQYALLKELLDQHPSGIRLIRYDAWKYGGSALKRNFLTNAAAQLGLSEDDNPEFFRGLYQTRRTVDIESGRVTAQLRALARPLLLAAVGVFFLVLTLALLLFILGADSFADEFVSLLRRVGPAVGGFIFSAGVLIKLLDVAAVQVEESAPSSDEQFTSAFRALIEKATEESTSNVNWLQRLFKNPQQKKVDIPPSSCLAFFIDELDRCSPQDIASTLVSLKTFLDERRCVFIVAADRAVLERGLEDLPQVSPAVAQGAYYGSAAAALDKIFQYQLDLPPLRGGRLSRFAADLVRERGGIWAELRSLEDKTYEDVLYALIPSHVRSPRRVKVLLNNFSVSMRIAQARGVDAHRLAPAIAKLTVMRTEFPKLAMDLSVDPRLTTLLLDPPEEATDKLTALLKKHQLTDDDA